MVQFQPAAHLLKPLPLRRRAQGERYAGQGGEPGPRKKRDKGSEKQALAKDFSGGSGLSFRSSPQGSGGAQGEQGQDRQRFERRGMNHRRQKDQGQSVRSQEKSVRRHPPLGRPGQGA